jgi:ABC-type multidrug transport system fused ATPase/permease subunit
MAANSFSFLYLFYYILHLPILAKVYKSMLWGTLLSPLTYFESTSTARILQRMAGDLKKLDKVVLFEFFAFISIFVLVFVCALCNFFAYFKAGQYGTLILFIIFLGLLYYQYRKYFIASQTHRHSEDELRVPINTYYS